MFKVIVLLAVFVAAVSAGGGGKIPNVCESAEELKFCRSSCSKDKDCIDEPNLNCAKRCKEACYVIEQEFGTRKRQCKLALMRTLVYQRNPEYIPIEKS